MACPYPSISSLTLGNAGIPQECSPARCLGLTWVISGLEPQLGECLRAASVSPKCSASGRSKKSSLRRGVDVSGVWPCQPSGLPTGANPHRSGKSLRFPEHPIGRWGPPLAMVARTGPQHMSTAVPLTFHPHPVVVYCPSWVSSPNSSRNASSSAGALKGSKCHLSSFLKHMLFSSLFLVEK